MTLLSPRWRKVLADLWNHRGRFLLVTASIAVGMFAVGLISSLYVTLNVDMTSSYEGVNPADIQLTTSGFTEDMVDTVRNMAGVTQAQGDLRMDLRLQAANDTWINLAIKTLPENDQQTINRLIVLEGKFPPDDHEVVLEVNDMDEIGAGIGDEITVQLPSGTYRQLKVVGIVRDQTLGVTGGNFFIQPPYGYVNYQTLPWLGHNSAYRTLLVTAEATSKEEVRNLSLEIKSVLENSGISVTATRVISPNEHPLQGYLRACSGILVFLGAMSVFLSGFLVSNMLNALFAQQIQYIGIMKAIGAQRSQIIRMYLVFILVFGLLALVVAVPLSAWSASKLSMFLAERLNFSDGGLRFVPLTIVLQCLIALVLPQAAGILPILNGAKVSVRHAMTFTGIDSTNLGQSWLDRQLNRLRNLSRPALISLRNTFRRKGRLVLTLITLVLGGSIFIATFSVRASLDQYIDRVRNYMLADIDLNLSRSYRQNEIKAVLETVPGIESMEGRAGAVAQLIGENDLAAETVSIIAAPPASALIQPIMISGRWLLPGDENAILLNEAFADKYPDMKAGDHLAMFVNGKKVDWVVIGFFQFIGKGDFLAYAPYDYVTGLTGSRGRVTNLQVIVEPDYKQPEKIEALAIQIEAVLRQKGYAVNNVDSSLTLVQRTTEGLNTLTIFLLIMACLMALVGSIGLAGTMGMNVMERTREIGVMRAIGATDRVIMRLVIGEGILIGLISWLVGLAASIPISRFMSQIMMRAIFQTNGDFVFTLPGVLIWLALVIVLSAFASITPARNAARLTIREVLAYE